MKKVFHYEEPSVRVETDDLQSIPKETLDGFKGNKGEEGT